MNKMTPVRKKMIIIRDMVVKENKDLKSILKLHGWTLVVCSNQMRIVTTLVDPSIVILSYEETIPLSMEQITNKVIRSVQLEVDRRTLVSL